MADGPVPEAHPVAVVGLAGRCATPLPPTAAAAVARATLVVGSHRHLGWLAAPGTVATGLPAPAPGARRLALTGDLTSALDAVAAHPGPVCVLASGDPGFFGVVRVLANRLGSDRLEVHPGPSSVALAFARLGLAWDDATVVSAHGRPLADAAAVAATRAKVAVLVSPDAPPEALGRSLLGLGASHDKVAVCSRLGEPDEEVRVVDLPGLAAGTWDPVSVVVLLRGTGTGERVLSWGLPDTAYAHREGMVTKAEIRAVALGKLALPPIGVLWDVGAGSASLAVEAARLQPGLRVVAVERRPADAERARENAAAHQADLQVVTGEAPAALAALADPDRVFLGGGGLAVLDAVLARLRPGGRVVATFAALGRATAAADRLGHLVQVGLARGRRLPDGGLRLAAENPVFVVWGPEE